VHNLHYVNNENGGIKTKILANFRLELSYLRAIEDLKNKLGLKSNTQVLKEAIKQLAYSNGIELKGECRWLQNTTTTKGRIQVYCGVRGNWIPYQSCLKCDKWGRRFL